MSVTTSIILLWSHPSHSAMCFGVSPVTKCHKLSSMTKVSAPSSIVCHCISIVSSTTPPQSNPSLASTQPTTGCRSALGPRYASPCAPSSPVTLISTRRLLDGWTLESCAPHLACSINCQQCVSITVRYHSVVAQRAQLNFLISNLCTRHLNAVNGVTYSMLHA